MKIVALSSDLMDRSRISGAVGDVEFVRDASGCTDADVVVIDLARHGRDVAEVRRLAPEARIVAFGPHVDVALLDQARADGADTVLARSAFFQNPAGALAP